MKLVYNYIEVTKQINDLSALSVDEHRTLKQEEKGLKDDLKFFSFSTFLFLICTLSFYLPVFYFFPEIDSLKSLFLIINNTKASFLAIIPFSIAFGAGVVAIFDAFLKKSNHKISLEDLTLVFAFSILTAFLIIFNILGFLVFAFLVVKIIMTALKYRTFMNSIPKTYIDSEQRVADLHNKQKRIFNAILEDKDALNVLSDPNHKINDVDKKIVQSLRKLVLNEKIKTVPDTELLTHITNAQINQILND